MITTVTVNQTLIQRLASAKPKMALRDKKKLSNHEMLLVALNPYKGQVLTSAEIKEIVSAKFPEVNIPSIQPNDHSDIGNLRCCSCVGTDRQLFINYGRAKYQVL
jgi:hypothetical protein